MSDWKDRAAKEHERALIAEARNIKLQAELAQERERVAELYRRKDKIKYAKYTVEWGEELERFLHALLPPTDTTGGEL